MSDSAATIPAWLLDPATSALEPPALLEGLVARLGAADLALHRVSIWIPTKHPELWGHQLVWTPEEGARVTRRSHEVSRSTDFVGTPAEALFASGAATLRCRLDREDERNRFEMLRNMAAAGATDYLLSSTDPGTVHGSWISFATRRPGGYDDTQLEFLAGLTPLLALHVQLLGARFATRSLLEVYLGANAARRVLAGEFRRGTGSELDAALWFCDMRGFTALSDRLPARAVVGILDRYFEHVAAPIEERGGEVLKFIGDATLAVFPIDEAGAASACRRALDAARAVLARIAAWSCEEAGPIEIGVALHAGHVLYGNIGGRERLDFTVIGASVNEVCRVESMCKVLREPLLMTAAFATALEDPDVVSLGRFELKGVAQAQEILTTRSR
ncbi:MAG TPA: adenylate/guanylate cyclase domain-containing protein [Pseudomonadota bacterium]|nr:adenylate/guanylate cyclase domain-containing protein [Pseudomonadota bacterium]HRA38382.1 adenylate/guanylate cyclase domain-containing protein [Pseudomonadota bacterium]